MVNLLFISRNLNSVQTLINKIMIQNFRVRTYSIYTTVNDSLNAINKDKNIDIIISMVSPNEIIELIEYLKLEAKLKYKNSIIMITEEKINFPQNYYFYINTVISYNDSFHISTAINNLSELKENNKKYSQNKTSVNKYLQELGYNFSHLGTYYIAEILLILLNSKCKSCPPLEKDLYPIVAENHASSIHNVKCTITLATKYMNCHKKTSINSNYLTTKHIINLFLMNQNKEQPLT